MENSREDRVNERAEERTEERADIPVQWKLLDLLLTYAGVCVVLLVVYPVLNQMLLKLR
jgi:hypothetical protein